MCSKLLKDTDVKIAAVVGFPLGAMDTESRSFEAKKAEKRIIRNWYGNKYWYASIR